MNRRTAFAKYTADGYTVQLLHCIGRTAIGVLPPVPNCRKEPIYVGRYGRFYVKAFTVEAVLTRLKEQRAERRAKDAQLITYEEAQHTLLTPAGCLRLFCLCLHLDCRVPHSRKEIRKAILSQRGPKSGFYLAKLAQIPFNS